jgi:hypothetical protein
MDFFFLRVAAVKNIALDFDFGSITIFSSRLSTWLRMPRAPVPLLRST